MTLAPSVFHPAMPSGVARGAMAACLLSSLAVAAAEPGDGCPDGGYERLGCDLARGRAELCGPKPLARGLARTARHVERARRAAERGVGRSETANLGRATRGLLQLETTSERLLAKGKLSEACASAVTTLADRLLSDIVILRAGTPTTTTTSTAPPPLVSTTTTTTSSTTLPGSVCGNGILERGEQCEGDTGGRTCKSLGFTAGTLRCGPDCLFDVSGCTR